MHVKKGMEVRVVCGNHKGLEGKVLNVFPKKQKVIIEGVNFRKRAARPTQDNPSGGFVEREAPIHISNVAFFDAKANKGVRVGYSISKAKKHLQCPFIFHVCDTILSDNDKVPDVQSNWVAGANCGDNPKIQMRQYRTLIVDNGKVNSFNEKGEMNFDYAYIGLCGIKDYKSFNTISSSYRISSCTYCNIKILSLIC